LPGQTILRPQLFPSQVVVSLISTRLLIPNTLVDASQRKYMKQINILLTGNLFFTLHELFLPIREIRFTDTTFGIPNLHQLNHGSTETGHEDGIHHLPKIRFPPGEYAILPKMKDVWG
jgi:hypothetical protein